MTGPRLPLPTISLRCAARCSTTSTTSSAPRSAPFLDKEVVPNHARVGGRRASSTASCSASAGANGFLGMAVPEEYGGGGVDDFRYNLVIAEEIQARRRRRRRARAHACTTTSACRTSSPTAPTSRRQRWLPGICAGELITAIAMTEPGIGSDLASMTTTAIRDGDHYVVNGSKTFITNGINADLVDHRGEDRPDASATAGMSLLVLERGMEGFERGRNLEKIGHARPGHRRAVLHRRARAGREPARRRGRGLPPARRATCRRSGCRSRSPASPRPAAAFDWTLDYAKERTGVRPADRLVPEQPLRARRDGDRDRDRPGVRRPVRARPQRRRAHRRGGGDGQVVVHRAAGAGRRPLRAAARRLRLHDASTRSPGPTPTPASPRSTAAPPRS